MRLALASAWFPVGVGAYLLRAAKRIRDLQILGQSNSTDLLEVVTVGPTSGAQCWAPCWQYPDHAIKPNFASHHEPGFVDWKPDLLVCIDGGYFINDRPPCPYAIVATDPHISEQGGSWTYERQREIADFFFCMQKPYCRTPTDHPAWPVNEAHANEKADHFLPYAYDPEVFHPYPDQPMDADVTVLGVPYPKRTLVAQELNRRGFRVLAGMGSVYEKYARDLCRAPVCFIWSLKDDVPCRVFEAAACGSAIVCNESIEPYINEIMPDLRVVFFPDVKDEAEAVCKAATTVEACFEHGGGVAKEPPGEKWHPLAKIRDTEHPNLIAVEPHTSDARLRTIVRTCLGKEL